MTQNKQHTQQKLTINTSEPNQPKTLTTDTQKKRKANSHKKLATKQQAWTQHKLSNRETTNTSWKRDILPVNKDPERKLNETHNAN